MPKTILVVDDEPDIIDLISKTLGPEGYEIIAAHDGEQALELAEKNPPDLIILDLVMPKVDGYTTALKLRAMDKTRFTPIIVLTVKKETRNIVDAYETKINDYITKPFNIDDLKNRVRRALGKEKGKSRRKKLGEILLEAGLITKEQLEDSLVSQKEGSRKLLGEILVEKGFITSELIRHALELQLAVPRIDLLTYKIDSKAVEILPEYLVRRDRVIPVKKEGSELYVAMTEPPNILVIDEIKLITGLRIKPMIAREEEILRIIEQHFGGEEAARKVIEDIKEEVVPEEEPKEDSGEVDESAPPVIRLVDSIIKGAINDLASDIHVEPQEGQKMQIRYRVDGILHDVMTIPRHIQLAVVSRVKILGGLDISERRLPQDGRISLKIAEKRIDFRISTMPTIYGEKLVIRILDKERMLIGLEELGFSEEERTIYESLVLRPYGMILVTGPTGSGKTTTLYATLNKINTRTKNIITIEDPVEYQLTGINQIQVNPKAGITFAKGLRSILRQDPNIVMVGEIRDLDTADIAIHAALTGHLVLSTLHTNDAASALTRLVDMNVEPFLISSAVAGVVSQRLVRKVCARCKKEYVPSAKEVESVGLSAEKDYKFSEGKGCNYCYDSGFRGRTGIFEILKVDEEIKALISKSQSSVAINKLAASKGMKSLRDNALEKVAQGVTTIEEIKQVIAEI